MADPLNYKKTGIPHRTSRERARAHGTKVPATPQADGYCAVHGHTHEQGSCQMPHDGADVASTGGNAKLPANVKPFKLGG